MLLMFDGLNHERKRDFQIMQGHQQRCGGGGRQSLSIAGSWWFLQLACQAPDANERVPHESAFFSKGWKYKLNA